MKVLLVYAHPEPKSLNGSLKNFTIQHLQNAGHEVQISDLYAMDWKAALDANDSKIDLMRPISMLLSTHSTRLKTAYKAMILPLNRASYCGLIRLFSSSHCGGFLCPPS